MVVTSRVRSPCRSSSALVATVVPILTKPIVVGGDRRAGAKPEQIADRLHGGVGIGGAFGEQFAHMQLAVGVAADDVGEGAAAVDPEIPALCGGLLARLTRHGHLNPFAAPSFGAASGHGL